MLVNNEIGVIQPVAEIAKLAHEAGALMLCDAVQGLGRVDIPEGPDLVAVSAHKIHGPKAIGALWMRDGVGARAADPRWRAGDGPPLRHAFAGALRGLRGGGQAGVRASLGRPCSRRAALGGGGGELGAGWTVNGSTAQRYHGNLNIRREGLDAARLISDLRDIAFSLGSACASGSGRPSHVLRAIGLNDGEARSSVRLGFGRYTTEEDLVSAVRRIDDAARAQQGLAA